MNKTCFIIMPISDISDYPPGHFKRVYEHLIKPACLSAGFEPIRADDVEKTNNIALDIVKRVIESDMALCDLSARNPNVLYELGIRQAFNKPVTLIKDHKTTRIFDISSFRDIEYDGNLRIDNVEAIISILSNTIKNTYNEHETNSNSLVSLLGIEAATVGPKTIITDDTKLILESLNEIHNRINDLEVKGYQDSRPKGMFESYTIGDSISSNDFDSLKIGDVVYHSKFGYGLLMEKKGPSNNPVIKVDFENGDSKLVMFNYARLKRGIKAELKNSAV